MKQGNIERIHFLLDSTFPGFLRNRCLRKEVKRGTARHRINESLDWGEFTIVRATSDQISIGRWTKEELLKGVYS
jgi:hypothetical protein